MLPVPSRVATRLSPAEGVAGARDLRAERLQAFGEQRGQLAEAFGLAGTAVHRDQLPERVEVGRAFGFGLAQQLGGWRVGSEGGGRKQEGEGERQEVGQAAGVHGRSSSGGRRRRGCAPRYPD